uniref:Uncharacterized protein n=1 Tax=Avena sativa TaxID=4498 RepID=A0ACD5TDG1_AVESA
MPPGGGGEGEHGSTAQDHPPATVHLDDEALPHSTPPLPAIVPAASQEKRQRHEQEHHPAASLPEGPLVEILARVPYRSLCRFKCVSKPWLALCSSPDIRKRSPQTLSGFFYKGSSTSGLHFHNLPGTGPPLVDPSLSFLRESSKDIYVDQVCGGLLLCICPNSDSIEEEESDYFVCNPATEEWTVLPPLVSPGQEFAYYVGFDAAVPSRFVVFVHMSIPGNDSGKVAIYSSETGQWSYVQSKWAPGTIGDLDPCTDTCVFHNGTMHWPTIYNSVVTVDSEGKVWREIKSPDDLPNNSDCISIGQSQGRLYAWQRDGIPGTQLYMWVLEDYTGKWTLTHIVNFSELFGRHYHKGDYYEMFAIHPDCNVIFLTDEKMTVSYNLDNHKLDIIFAEPIFGLPYIPSLVELPSVGH